MENNQDTKKCFCARCFLPIDTEDKVAIEGQNFHRICGMCCICRTIPTSLKMFYGHVFCNDCFQSHVMARFKDENARMTSNSWWMHWSSGNKPQSDEKTDAGPTETPNEQSPKRFICARCLQSVDESNRITIGDQSFHGQCARCYFCHKVPSANVKIYYGQVFCEECFHRHVLNRSQDNPSEFFKNCFEQWQNNAQFAENMREFMSGNRDTAPFIFMMQGQQPPFCRCGTGPQEWSQPNEPRKSVLSTISTDADLSKNHVDNSTEEVVQIANESAGDENFNVAEKIEKLTKYLQQKQNKSLGAWKFLDPKVKVDPIYYLLGWTDLQNEKYKKCSNCPKCLWQCGPLNVNNASNVEHNFEELFE